MAVLHASVRDAIDFDRTLTVDAAYARSCRAALADPRSARSGWRLETHLVDLDSVADPVAWDRVEPMPSVAAAPRTAAAR